MSDPLSPPALLAEDDKPAAAAPADADSHGCSAASADSIHAGPDWSDWDSALHNYSNRLTVAYLGRSWRSDIAFYIEEEDMTIPAHSLIVAAASPVLERCCFGTGDCVKPVAIIRVPNCSVNAFWVVLRHLYANKDADHVLAGSAEHSAIASSSDQFRLTAIAENIGLNIDNAAEVLCLAEYYDLRQLRRYCKPLLLSGLNVDNVIAIYSHVRLLEDQTVAERCIQKIVFNAQRVFDEAMEMDESAVAEFLRANDLRLEDEADVFYKLLLWAQSKCEGDHLCAASCRRLLQTKLKHVRFGSMSSREFVNCIDRAREGFFTMLEVGTIMHRISLGQRFECANPFEEVVVATDRPSVMDGEGGDVKQELDVESGGSDEQVEVGGKLNEADVGGEEDTASGLDKNERDEEGNVIIVGDEMEKRISPVPYWCEHRNPIVISEKVENVGNFNESPHYRPEIYGESKIRIRPIDCDFEYALSGLLIPNFNGEIRVKDTQSEEYVLAKTRSTIDVVYFDKELLLNADNCWDLSINVIGSVHCCVPNKSNGTFKVELLNCKATVIKAVHYISWKR